MAQRLSALPAGFKVGICWRSQFSHRDRDIHYTQLEMWEPIFRIPGLVFRSEEHTSELQSLMRISYAVFCLKKKINKTNKQTTCTLNNNRQTCDSIRKLSHTLHSI